MKDLPESGNRASGGAVALGKLQLAILRVLWRRSEAAVSEVHADLLPSRGLAPTTIATMLVKMERRGLVDHRTEGRKFIYRATVSEPQVKRSMVSEFTDRLFEGDVAALVSHLISQHETDSADLAELKRLIAEREAEEESR